MMNVRTFGLQPALLTLIMSAQFTVAQTYRVSLSVVGSGGAPIANSNYRMTGTVAQPVTGISQNSMNIHKIGFWYPLQRLATAVEEPAGSLPSEFRVEQNYPNPFNPSTVIRYQLPTRGTIHVNIYNSLGQLVRRLVSGQPREAGMYTITWDGRNDAGSPQSSGMYFCQLRISDPSSSLTLGQIQGRKMLLLR